jgi:hypothetical protein
MIGSVAWLKKAREAVEDVKSTVSASVIIAVIALVLAAAAMYISVRLGLVYGRKQAS